MIKLDNEDLPTLQREVQRLLGRCLLRVQQYEQLIKAMVAHHQVSGPICNLESIRVAQVDATAGKTLGTLVGDLIGSYVAADEIDPPEDTTINSPENVNWYAMQMTLSLPGEEFAQVERELRELVQLRNDLVHHFINQHDLWSSDGCRAAQDALVISYDRIDQHFRQLREWAEDMENMRQAMSEFKDIFVNGNTPDKKFCWDASGIVDALREAFGALAVDGWAPLNKAGKWIAKRYPEQVPAKYGCRRWRQVVHSAPILELRYLEVDGQRTACYREKKSTAKPR